MKTTQTPTRWRDIWIDGVQLSAKNAREVERAVNSYDELLAALKESQAALMDMHKHARGMWNELLDAGFAEKNLKMPCHDRNLAAIATARTAIAKADG